MNTMKLLKMNHKSDNMLEALFGVTKPERNVLTTKANILIVEVLLDYIKNVENLLEDGSLLEKSSFTSEIMYAAQQKSSELHENMPVFILANSDALEQKVLFPAIGMFKMEHKAGESFEEMKARFVDNSTIAISKMEAGEVDEETEEYDCECPNCRARRAEGKEPKPEEVSKE